MILYGGSGHAKVIRDCVKASGKNVSFIFDDNPDIVRLYDTPVVGRYDAGRESGEEMIIAVGDNLLRKKISEQVKHKFGKAIHPSVQLSPHAMVGEGSVVFHGAIIQAGAVLGKHVIINTGSIVEHDSYVADYSHISPNVTLCSGVVVGEGTHIGAGAVIIPNRKIGKWCVIGAGSVITQDIPDFSMVVGVPGKIIRTLVKKAHI